MASISFVAVAYREHSSTFAKSGPALALQIEIFLVITAYKKERKNKFPITKCGLFTVFKVVFQYLLAGKIT